MERNRDLRKASISSVNGLPRRRQRITTLRDSTDQDRQIDLQETVRLEDRQQLHKKDREREFLKRRRVDKRSDGVESFRENESTDSSDEEYYDEEEETWIHQQNRTNQTTSSSLSNNRRGLRTLRSSPVLRAAADEMFGVPIPRRARSAKKLHEYCNSGSGSFAEDFSHRRFSPVSLIGSDGTLPSSSGASLKKKMKSVDLQTPVLNGASNPNPSVIQDDIEIEVAEALFDLMKQSQSQSQPSRKQEKVDKDSTNASSDELKMLKADGEDESNAFSVRNASSLKVNAETILGDSVKEVKGKGRIEREIFPYDQVQDLNVDLLNRDGLVNKVIVGSPKESESPSCVIKVNACDIQDPTVTNAHNEAIIAEAKKETKLEIDLMALPSVPPSLERDALIDKGTDDPEVITQDVQKKSETVSKDGALAVAIGTLEEKIGIINSSQLQMEKRRHDERSAQQQQGRKEQRNQCPTSLLSLPIGMSSWPGVLTHQGCIPPIQGVLPINGSARSSMIMQPPQFKFSQPRPRRCATHQFLARNIQSHQELMKKSLSSGSIGSPALCGTKPSNLKYIFPPTQNLIEGVKGRNFDADVASNATINEKSVLQHASHPPSASNFLRGPGFIFPFGQYQTTMVAPANSSGSPQSVSPVGNAPLPSNRLSVNLPLHSSSSVASLNHPLLPSNEAYMAMLQNNACPIPISTNIAMPSFKGGSPSMPLFNPSLYSPPVFNVSQNQQQLIIPQTTNSSHKQFQSQKQTSDKISDNKFPTSVTTNPPLPVTNCMGAHSIKPTNSQSMSCSKIPPGNKNIDPPHQVSKDRVELFPQPFASQNSAMFHILPDMSFNLSKSDCKEKPVGPPKFDGLARSINFLPSSLTVNQNHHHQQSIQVQNPQMHQLAGSMAQIKPSAPNGSFLTSIFPSSNSNPVFTHVSMGNDNSAIPRLKSTQGQSHTTFGNNPIPASSLSNPGISHRNASKEAEAPHGGTGQKSSSPACRRIVPSILSTCPGQLPELKY